jgi:serine/threonine protein kinase
MEEGVMGCVARGLAIGRIFVPEAIMGVTTGCPTEQMLKHFMLGHNTPEEALSLEAHLDRCEQCLEKFSTLHAEDSLLEAIRSPHGVEPTAAESDHLLAEWLKALRPESALQTDEAVTVAPAKVVSGGDTTVTYPFLKPSQNPHDLGQLGRYEVRKVLGSGGMGVVFQAFDPELRRLVALKTTLPALAENPSAKERFKREARAAAAIKHDHIVTIYDVGEDHGIAYLAMEFLEGESLDQRIQRECRLPWREALRITRESAQGLAAAHQQQLIHRDIKPGNIWLEKSSEDRGVRSEEKSGQCTPGFPLLTPHSSLLTPFSRVKILDFGLALPTSDNAHLTQSGAIVGTPAFMAPEQCRGQGVDARSDLFSLGCVLYRMATGEAPFGGNHAISILIAVVTASPRPPQDLNPELPQAVCALITRLLAKDPAERPPSAAALIEAIQAIEQERVQPAAPVRRARRPLVGALAGVAVACLLGSLGYWSLRAPQPYGPQINQQAPNADDPALKAVSDAGKGPRQFYADPAHALDGVLDHREITGADAGVFRKWQASLGSDFRLAFVNTRQGTGPVLYNAVAVREKVPRLVRYRPDVPELPDAGLKDVWDSLKLDGFRLLSCTVQASAEDEANWTESLLWIKDDAIADWYVQPAGLAAVTDDLKAARSKGYRPYNFNMRKDGTSFIPFVAPIQDRLWKFEPDLTAEELLAAVKSSRDRGWRPDVLTPYFDNGRLRFLLVAVGNDDGPDWRFRMAMSHDQYQQEAAEQRDRGLFPLTIVSYGNDADVRYAAIWVRYREPGTKAPESLTPDAMPLADRAGKAASWASTGPKEMYVDGARALGAIVDFRELVGGTPKELRDWHEKLAPKFRIAGVSSRNGAGEVLFNAVAVHEKASHESRFPIQMTDELAKQTYNQNGADQFRLLVSCPNLDPGEKLPWHSTQIWVKDGNTSMFWYGWLYDVVHWTKDKKETPKEFRPIAIDARMAPPDGGIGLNIVLGPGLGRAWESFHTLTQDELLTAIEFYQRKGWRPDVVLPYMKDGQVRNNLVVVDNSDKIDWCFRTDLSQAEYEKESAAQKSLGLFPLNLVSYGDNAAIRYAAIFVRYIDPAKK